MAKKTISLIIASLMALVSFCFTAYTAEELSALSPSSLLGSTWAQSELEKADKFGLIPYCLNGTDLTKPITRAEFTAMAVKTYEKLTGSKVAPPVANPFIDTKDSEVLKAYSVGITSGTTVDMFSPNMLLNREQAAAMLTRVLKAARIPGWTSTNDSKFALYFTQPLLFADDDIISDWAKHSVYFMAANNISLGTGNNMFSPRAATSAEQEANYAIATREQALIMAVRIIENLFDWDGNIMPISRPAPIVTHGVVYQSSSANFEYYAAESVKGYVNHISTVLESAYAQLGRELDVVLDDIITVRVYPNYKSFCESIEREFSPDVTPNRVFGYFKKGWNDGTDGIYMTPPNSEIVRDPENFYDKTLLHEFVHVLAEQITPAYILLSYNLQWLAEGLADYKSGQLTRKYARDILKASVKNNTVPSLSELEIKDIVKFDHMEGYTFGASIIEFIDNNYGFAKIVELYKNPGQYETVFGLTKDELEKEWRQFLNDNYCDNTY